MATPCPTCGLSHRSSRSMCPTCYQKPPAGKVTWLRGTEEEERLFNAAPDLLEALKQVQADLSDRLTGKTMLMIRTAIAKAEKGCA